MLIYFDGSLLPEEHYPKTKAAFDDAGVDLHAAETYMIWPGDRVLINTGLRLMTERGDQYPFLAEMVSNFGLLDHQRGRIDIEIRARSSFWLKGMDVFNGTVDLAYQSPIKVGVENRSKEMFCLEKGDRFAQLIIKVLPSVVFQRKDDFLEKRGGFGHTGKGV